MFSGTPSHRHPILFETPPWEAWILYQGLDSDLLSNRLRVVIVLSLPDHSSHMIFQVPYFLTRSGHEGLRAPADIFHIKSTLTYAWLCL